MHADKDRVVAVHRDGSVRHLRGKFDYRNVFHAHKATVIRLDNHTLEIVNTPQIRICCDIGDSEIALGLACRSLEVVSCDCSRNFSRRYAMPSHFRRV
ncbi:hypothetical protein ABIF42_008411 [Bradyrhizobium diazoefficiens]